MTRTKRLMIMTDRKFRSLGWDLTHSEAVDIYYIDGIELKYHTYGKCWSLKTGLVSYITLMTRLAEWWELVMIDEQHE